MKTSLLLCRKHHDIIDSQVSTYTAESLHGMKSEHEALVEQAVGQAVAARRERSESRKSQYVTEELYSKSALRPKIGHALGVRYVWPEPP